MDIEPEDTELSEKSDGALSLLVWDLHTAAGLKRSKPPRAYPNGVEGLAYDPTIRETWQRKKSGKA
jgi:hypothetical protein